MNTRLLAISVPLLACLLAIVMCQVAAAFPSQGGSCLACHATPGGSMNISPDPIEIMIGDHGVITFDIIEVPGARSAISLSGLEEPNLDAMFGAGGDNWTWIEGPRGSSYISDIIITSGPYRLDLGIGADAVGGLYGIDASLVGTDQSGSAYDFSVIVVEALGVEPSTGGEAAPLVLALHGPYPNPFNPSAALEFDIPVLGLARLLIYDAHGRRVRALHDGMIAPGRHRVTWEGRDDHGRQVASGIYWLRLESGNELRFGRAVLIR